MKRGKTHRIFIILLFCVIVVDKSIKVYRAVQQHNEREMYWSGFMVLVALAILVYQVVQYRKTPAVPS